MPAETSSRYTRLQRQEQWNASLKPESPFEMNAEPLTKRQPTTTQQQQRMRLNYPWQSTSSHWPVIDCLVVGHETAQTHNLMLAFVKKMTESSKINVEDNASVDVLVPVSDGTVYKLCLANCIEISNLWLVTFCNIIVICYSVVNEVSYQDVRNAWVKQVKKVYPDKPYLLVGTQ
jgi:hypothetical protein